MIAKFIYRFIVRNWWWIYPIVDQTHRYIKYFIKRLNNNDMERLGVFTPQQEKFLVKAISEFIKTKNKFWGWLAGYGLKLVIKGVDNFGLDRIGLEWKKDLIPIVDAAMTGRYEDVRTFVTDLLNKKIDLDFADEETELRWFDSLTKFFAASIDFFVQRKKLKGNLK